jgi:hypothetical protein
VQRVAPQDRCSAERPAVSQSTNSATAAVAAAGAAVTNFQDPSSVAPQLAAAYSRGDLQQQANMSVAKKACLRRENMSEARLCTAAANVASLPAGAWWDTKYTGSIAISTDPKGCNGASAASFSPA